MAEKKTTRSAPVYLSLDESNDPGVPFTVVYEEGTRRKTINRAYARLSDFQRRYGAALAALPAAPDPDDDSGQALFEKEAIISNIRHGQEERD
jgi:hypothetical protein